MKKDKIWNRITGILLTLAAAACLWETLPVFAERDAIGWGFDGDKEQAGLPAGMPGFYNNKSISNGSLDEPGPSGKAGDYAYGFASCVGANVPEGLTKDKGTGLIVCGEAQEGPVVLNYDFKIKRNDVMKVALATTRVMYRNFDLPVFAEKGVITVGGTEIGKIGDNEWHNIGIIYNITDTGKTVSVYLDDELKADGIASQNKLINDVVIAAGSNAVLGPDDPPRAGDRNELIYIDNLYVGGNPENVRGDFHSMPRAEVQDASTLAVTFFKTVDQASAPAEAFSVDGTPAAGITWAQNGRTAYLTLAQPLGAMGSYTLAVSGAVRSTDGYAYTGNQSISIATDLLDQTWDFNDQLDMPAGVVKNMKANLPTYTKVAGRSGAAEDWSFGWPVGIGQGKGTGTYDKYSEGIQYLKTDISMNDMRIVTGFDFKIGNNNMLGALLALRGGQYSDIIAKVEFGNNTVYAGDPETGFIGKVYADEWHRLDVICDMSSKDGIRMEIYFDGERKLSGVGNPSQRDGMKAFSILTQAATTEEEFAANARFDGRGEIIYIDNLYVSGDDARIIQGKTGCAVMDVTDGDGNSVLSGGIPQGNAKLSVMLDAYSRSEDGILLLVQKTADGSILQAESVQGTFDALAQAGMASWSRVWTVETEVQAGAEKLELFLWKNTETMVPWCASETVPIQ